MWPLRGLHISCIRFPVLAGASGPVASFCLSAVSSQGPSYILVPCFYRRDFRVAASLKMEPRGTLNLPCKQAEQTSIAPSFNPTIWQGTFPSALLTFWGLSKVENPGIVLAWHSHVSLCGSVICVTANQIHSSVIIRHWTLASFGNLFIVSYSSPASNSAVILQDSPPAQAFFPSPILQLTFGQTLTLFSNVLEESQVLRYKPSWFPASLLLGRKTFLLLFQKKGLRLV